MAQQLIDIGSVANDGTGDTLRQAGDKINDNFTELYTQAIRAVTGTTDTVLNTDFRKIVAYDNASGCAVTLPQAGASSQFALGWRATFFAKPTAGTVTITPTSCQINGDTDYELAAGKSIDIYSDGSNFWVLPGV